MVHPLMNDEGSVNSLSTRYEVKKPRMGFESFFFQQIRLDNVITFSFSPFNFSLPIVRQTLL